MRLVTLAAFLCLSGCSMLSHRATLPGPSIAEATRNLPAAEAAPKIQAPAKPNAGEVLALYQGVVGKVNNRELRYQITQRISALQLEQANTALSEGRKASFGQAIHTLQKLLADPDSKQDAGELRYKLAYAYDLSGSSKEMLVNLNKAIEQSPSQRLRLEARFRRAEVMFSKGNYRDAARDYAVVSTTPNAYQLHALYMLGWSDFKLGDLQVALKPMMHAMAMLYDPHSAASQHEQELLKDLTRVAVITLDYQKGPETLAKLMANSDRPAWQLHLYTALADWYHKKQRFQDSARTWETFLHENPLYADAPRIALKVIQTYRQAGFVDGIGQRKRAFVLAYDKASAFYKVHGDAAFPSYRHSLRTSIEDLTANADARAQHSKKPADYLAAATWYARWRNNFAGAPGSDKMLFLEAQALESGGATRRAISTWRAVAADYPHSKYTRDATYAIVVDLEALAKQTKSPLIEKRIAASLAFARNFSSDPRAPATQLSAAKLRYDAGNYRAAARIADDSLKRWQMGSLWHTTLLISANSHFANHEFATAETGYRALLTKSPNDHAIKQRLMASVLEQGQAAETAGKLTAAINVYKRLVDIDPTNQLAINASYDMAALYEKSGQLVQAADQLTNFRNDHPKNPATHGIAMRLASLDERLSRFGAAAGELLKVHARASDTRIAQAALYHGGELYLKANESAAAIDAFRDYAHDHNAPLGLRLEAMQHLDTLYAAAQQPGKRRYWLAQEIATVDAAQAKEVNERARYLAANASLVLANDKLKSYEAVQLTLPLKRALHRKQSAMKIATAAYKKVATYGVAQFVNAATFNTAQIYQSLAQSIVKSQRPPGLNKLERAQYDLLLEEQADPFVHQAISIYNDNLRRAWRTSWDTWVDKSLASLTTLSPGRFKREEAEVDYVKALY